MQAYIYLITYAHSCTFLLNGNAAVSNRHQFPLQVICVCILFTLHRVWAFSSFGPYRASSFYYIRKLCQLLQMGLSSFYTVYTSIFQKVACNLFGQKGTYLAKIIGRQIFLSTQIFSLCNV